LDHPGDWEISDHELFKIICSPGEEACFAVSVYARLSSSLQEFAAARLDREREIPAATGRYEARSRHWQGVGQEFRGMIATDRYETYRCVLCATSHGVFVSLTLNTSLARFAEEEATFRRVQNTLRSVPPGYLALCLAATSLWLDEYVRYAEMIMSDVARFPPLPPMPDPPTGLVDERQQAFGAFSSRIGEALDGESAQVGVINVVTGYPAAAVNLGELQEVLEAALQRFDMKEVRDRWDDDVFVWLRRVLLAWVQRCKFIHFDLESERGIHIQLQTQDDRGYYQYEFDIFPGRQEAAGIAGACPGGSR
jgi:hypothetical protein